MDLSQCFSTITKIFSENGLSIGSFTVKCEEPINISISGNRENIKISFPKNRPKVKIHKIITMYFDVLGIHFSETGGVLELHRALDIPFKYEWIKNDE